MTQNFNQPWVYDSDQTGMPVVDALGQRVCDMDCMDFYEICDDDVSKVAEYEQRRDKMGALVAAAPDLVTALHTAEGHLSAFFMTGDGKDDSEGQVSAALDVIRAAIKQAKGE